jgi:hypothetical protein
VNGTCWVGTLMRVDTLICRHFMLCDDPSHKVLANSRIIMAAMTWFSSLCSAPFCISRGNRFDTSVQIRVLRHQSKKHMALLATSTRVTTHGPRCGLCPGSGSIGGWVQASLQHDEVVSIEDLVWSTHSQQGHNPQKS